VSLSGNLGFVPIEEVLRLLTRSKQQGAVEVTGSGVRGRVFVGRGGIDLATTWGDDDLHRHLVNSGFTEESSLRRITTAETTLAAIAESNQAMIDLLREMTVESLYQMGHRGDEFEVHEGLTTPYASPKSFELESLLEDASDLATAIRFRRDLGEREEVTVKVDDWKVLSEIGLGSTIRDIADHLGTTEFWTARVAARLVKNDLVVVAGGVDHEPMHGTEPEAERSEGEPAHEPLVDGYTPSEDHEASEQYESGDDHDHSDDEFAESPVEPEAAVDDHVEFAPGSDQHESDEDLDPGESWWQEPEDEDDDREISGLETPEVVSEELSEMPSVDGEVSEVEEDTEAFLEKVFSELEATDGDPGSETEPDDEGHGLLRRRRMGTLRDFSSDS
jgi:hypothetical protein